ncbi:hypothetical protein [Photobacterium phosphoreum]|uniref:hypothetical protein n=1 Tax=Photobacterium phosphoreum TaxID=659 RepID=UPI001E57F6BB|nr:hypothetical protein [Photobacterium phosphoreum]
MIAVIEFFHPKSGHGTDLLKFLVKIADKYEISRIGIEQTNEESSVFAEKFGFINFQRDCWIVNIAELKIQFKL